MLIGHQKTKILPFSVAQVDIRIPSLGKVGYSRRAFLLLLLFFPFCFLFIRTQTPRSGSVETLPNQRAYVVSEV